MSENSVIEKINQKAEQEAAEIWENGRKRALEIEDNILSQAEKDKTAILYKAQKDCEAIMKTAGLNATLQSRKNTLSDKQALLGEVFEDALKVLDNLDDELLIKLIDKLVLDAAMSGKVKLVIAKENYTRYEKLFGTSYLKKWSDNLTEKYGVQTSVSLEKGDFSEGGIIIVGEKWDVDCRFSALIKKVKDNDISEVSNILFG